MSKKMGKCNCRQWVSVIVVAHRPFETINHSSIKYRPVFTFYANTNFLSTKKLSKRIDIAHRYEEKELRNYRKQKTFLNLFEKKK